MESIPPPSVIDRVKASTSVDCGQIWLKQIVLAQVFAPLQYKNIVLGVGSLKNAEYLKSAKTGFCAAFKVSTSVDCWPIWLKQIELPQFVAPLQYENIFCGVGPLKNAKYQVPKMFFFVCSIYMYSTGTVQLDYQTNETRIKSGVIHE